MNLKDKRGMIGRMIGGFVVIMVGTMMIGPMAEQLNGVCLAGNMSNSSEKPLGSTDSFGGGGTEHFGGYDGNVVHKSFITQTIEDNYCPVAGTWQGTMIALLPGFFVLGILAIGIMTTTSILKSSGLEY